MPYELKGRNVLVTGGSAGLGAIVSTSFAQQGCNVAINYFNRLEPAQKVQKECEGFGVKAVVIKADMTDTAGCKKAVEETIEKLSGIDIVIANAGWTRFSEFDNLDSMDESEWDKCWAANVKAPHALLKAAKPTFLKNEEGGVMITTGSIAAVSQAGSSMPYAVTKAAQLQLVKCLGATQGPKIRVNTVLPGLLLTEWVCLFLPPLVSFSIFSVVRLPISFHYGQRAIQGLKYSPEMIQAVKDKAALKHETYLKDCADAFIMLAKNTSMTGMRIQVDAGLNVQGD
ncbi:short chain dehydrogenase/reductase [Lentithecium fluviatile CBS 122367]|uniref:Short chain dehydrogenase/reductase n=1 Tax=Lentithecium fluviatile CBS 122367 TaxID=1168545 RepID=A0A6G1JKY5_9PLEO|nr:short chain dehydrogenase/reductase [Lentithecium fluviatile CBS 122367]